MNIKKKSVIVLKNNLFILVLSALFLILLLPSVSSTSFQSGVEIDYKVLCLTSGVYCDAETTCIASILYPDYTALVSNATMTNKQYYHNYTISPQSTIGTYTAYIVCVKGEDSKYSSIETFDITPTGRNLDTSQGIFFIILLVGLAGLFLFIGSTFDQDKWLIKSALFAASLLIMIIAVNMGMQFSMDNTTSSMMFTAFVISITAITLLFAYILVMYFVNIIKALKEAKQQERMDAELL